MLTADIIYGFTNSLLLDKFDNPTATPQFHLELWDLMCTDHPKVAVAAPRGHAKSTAVTHSYVLANICFREKKHVLIVSDTEGQAIDFLRDIKAELLENELLISTFGIRRLIKDREAEIIGEFDDGQEFRIIAKGSEQKVRGLKWRNTRPDLIIGDDLENDEIVMNEDRREKFRKWFYNALLPCGSKNCSVRIVGTILHLDSLLERLMPQLHDEDTVDDGLRQYSTKEKAWKSYRYRAHSEDFEQILWVEQWPRERLEALRADYIEQGFPEGYSQEYLNYPLDNSRAIFRVEDFLELSDPDGPEEYYVSVDLAISERDSRAYTVIAVASMAADGVLRYKDVRRFRGDSLEIVDELFWVVQAYNPEMVFVEKENIARSIHPIILKEMDDRGVYFNLELLIPDKDKVSRARPLQARMRARKVEFDTEAAWFPEFMQELLSFPRGLYKDQVDAASWIPLGIQKIIEVPTRTEWEEEQWESEYEDTLEEDLGKSLWCGY